MSYTPVAVADDARQKAAYESGLCNVYNRATLSRFMARGLHWQRPDDSIVLPEILTKEPYGPATLQSDVRWQAVVKWVHFALLDAEELGVTGANVDAMKGSDNADVRALLGSEGSLGKASARQTPGRPTPSRPSATTARSSTATLGAGSKLQIPRGLNAPVGPTGAIQFAPAHPLT